MLEGDDEKLVYTGYVKEEVRQRIQNADYYILESNHGVKCLCKPIAPIYLKQRIIGDSERRAVPDWLVMQWEKKRRKSCWHIFKRRQYT